jgi:hypothetical protein
MLSIFQLNSPSVFGAHRAAPALQGVEHAPDGRSSFQVLRASRATVQHLVEVVDFFLELLEENFAESRRRFHRRVTSKPPARPLPTVPALPMRGAVLQTV